MIGIAQYGHTYHFIKWIPSESGPLVTHYGYKNINFHAKSNNDWDYHEIFENLFEFINEDEPLFTLSLDLNVVKISSIFIDENPKDMIQWYFNHTNEKEFIELMDFYYYPMFDKKNLFMLSIPKIIRTNIKTVIKSQRSELRSLGIGIFSAEIGARQWFHASQFESYLIWRIDKKNINQFILIDKGQLSAYFVIKKRGNKINKIQLIGNRSRYGEVINDLSNLDNNSSSKFLSCDKVFIYNIDGSSKKIKEIQAKNIENMLLLNPLLALKNSLDKQYNIYKTLPLAETGLAFRGIDV